MESTQVRHHDAWNEGTLVGQKAPFKLKEIWSIRVRLEMQGRLRELALFDLGIDSKLRACDLPSLHVRDVCHGDRVAGRAIVLQQKAQRPVQFEITLLSVTPSSRAQCGASESRWTTHWRWRSRQRCSLTKLGATAGLGGRWPAITGVSADGKEPVAAAGRNGATGHEETVSKGAKIAGKPTLVFWQGHDPLPSCS